MHAEEVQFYYIVYTRLFSLINIFLQNARLSDDDEGDKDDDLLKNNDPHSLLNVDLEKYDFLLRLCKICGVFSRIRTLQTNIQYGSMYVRLLGNCRLDPLQGC